MSVAGSYSNAKNGIEMSHSEKGKYFIECVDFLFLRNFQI